jgi:hypothetical protein
MPTKTNKELQIHWTGLEGKKIGAQTGIGYWMDVVYFLFRTPEGKWGAARAIFGVDEAELIAYNVSAHAATVAAREDCRQRQVERGY